MTNNELREKLREAKTPEERRALLEKYRLYIMRTTTVRQRYKEMDRFLRELSSISRGFTPEEAVWHSKLLKRRSVAKQKLYDV